MIQWLKNLFGANPGDPIEGIAQEIDRCGDRFSNANDSVNANLAKQFSATVRMRSRVVDAELDLINFKRAVGIFLDRPQNSTSTFYESGSSSFSFGSGDSPGTSFEGRGGESGGGATDSWTDNSQ